MKFLVSSLIKYGIQISTVYAKYRLKFLVKKTFSQNLFKSSCLLNNILVCEISVQSFLLECCHSLLHLDAQITLLLQLSL